MSGIFGSDSPDPPQFTPPPEPFQFGSFRDFLNNVEVEQKEIGGKQHLTQKLIKPDNPVYVKFMEHVQQQVPRFINEIVAVARENPRLVAPFHGFINTLTQLNEDIFKDWTQSIRPEDFTSLKDDLIRTNTFLNNEEWDNYDHRLELDLTARGIANSDVANDLRVKAMRGRALTNDQIRNSAEAVAEQRIDADLARKQVQFQGRSEARRRAMDIAGQKFGLEEQEVNKNLVGRDDRMQKLMAVLGLHQNVRNEDINIKRGANITPTVLSGQDAITGRQQAAWQAENQNKLNQYQIGMQKYTADNAMTGGLIGSAAQIGSMFAMPYMFPSLFAAQAGTGAIGAGGKLAMLAR